MHKLILTAAAVAAVSVSAAAQQGGISEQAQPGEQTQPQSRTLPRSSQTLAGYLISPQQLNSSQVREIQQALAERIDGSVRVDGEWGPDTELALQNFQKSQGMKSQAGELDFPTISALGLDPLSFGLAGTDETTGQAPDDGASQAQRGQGVPGQVIPQTGEVR